MIMVTSGKSAKKWEKSQRKSNPARKPRKFGINPESDSRASNLSQPEIVKIQSDYDELVASAKLSQQQYMARTHGDASSNDRPSEAVTATITHADLPRLVTQGMTLMRPSDGPDKVHNRRLEVNSQLSDAERGKHSMRPNKSKREYDIIKAVLDQFQTPAGLKKFV